MTETARLVTTEPDGMVLYITLNRPDRANALNPEMLVQFEEALEGARHDDSVRVVVIRGAGRGFSAGYDMDRPRESAGDGRRDPLAEYRHDRELIERWLKVWDFPKAVIAQVHGYCMGGATQLAFLCDLTYVAEDTRIQYAAMRAGSGLIPPTWALAIGPKRAKEFGFPAGTTISGTTAVEWGWANHAVPASELADVVAEMAIRIAIEPPGLVELEKAAINRMFEAAGFRTALLTGALSNAVGHGSFDSAAIHQEIQEIGAKEFAKRKEEKLQELIKNRRSRGGPAAT
jgi:enoyl-CoA hydratase/carnithine racemase